MMQYFVGWIGTIMATSAIRVMTYLNILKDVADQGYKIKIGKMHENVGGLATSDDTGADKIVDYIPLVNMMNSFAEYTGYLYNRENVLMTLDQLNVVEEMDEVEKVDYKNKPNVLSLLKIYRNNARKREEAIREQELKYSLDKIHEMHVLEEYIAYYGDVDKARMEYEIDKSVRLHDNDQNLEEKLKDYKYLDLGADEKIYYTVDNSEGIYSLDDFRVIYLKGRFKNDDVTFNERKVGYTLFLVKNDKIEENEIEKVNKLNRK